MSGILRTHLFSDYSLWISQGLLNKYAIEILLIIKLLNYRKDGIVLQDEFKISGMQ